jgi:hypothetical protein
VKKVIEPLTWQVLVVPSQFWRGVLKVFECEEELFLGRRQVHGINGAVATSN